MNSSTGQYVLWAPPGSPPLPQGPGLGLASSGSDDAPRTSNSTLVHELKSTFEACFASLIIQEYWKDALEKKHLTKLRHWQQMLENINVQHKKPAEFPQGSLAYLEQVSTNIPAPLKQT
uniref:Mediator of RNA polymerase II transcription subunit 28 n=1 Tax=Urocitellus parryii TaxID=9999 RepID=A0A8D2HZ94_UROPR